MQTWTITRTDENGMETTVFSGLSHDAARSILWMISAPGPVSYRMQAE